MLSPSPRAPWQFCTWAEDMCLRNRKAVIVTIVLFHLFSFNGLWRFGSGSALYLTVGRSIARGDGGTWHGVPQHTASPGLPYLIAQAMLISQKHAVAIVDAAVLLMGLASIYLAWQLFRRITRPGAALVATALLAANFHLYERCFEILPDIPVLFGTLMILLGCIMSGLIPVPRLDDQAHPASRTGRRVGVIILLAGLVICILFGPIIVALAACVVSVGIISAMSQRHWRSPLMLTSLVGAVGGVYLLASMSDQRGITQVIHLLVQRTPVSPHMIPLLPVVILAWWHLAGRINAKLGRYFGNVFALVMFLLLVPGAVRCVSDVWRDQYRLPFALNYHDGQWAAVAEAGTLIRASTPSDAVVIAPSGTDRVLTFLADRWVIPADQHAPDRMRSHPVYALAGPQAQLMQVDLDEPVGQTDSKSPTGEIYTLRKARWK